MAELFETFDKNLYRINSSVYPSDLPPSQLSASSMSSIDPNQIDSGGSTGQTTQYVGASSVGKQGFTNTETGYILGIDAHDGKAKFYIGNTTNYLNWTGTELIISGTITATTGNIGGFLIGTTDLSATSGGNQTILSSGLTAFSAGPTGSPTVTITQAGVLTATGATITGTITASAGAIGGFNIGTDYIRDAANSFGLASTVTGGNDVRFWAGDTFANRATAPLRLYEDGSIVGTNATFTGALFATSGWIGSPTALVYESEGINTGTTGFIRGGQTAYNTGTGYFLGYDVGQYKLSIGNTTNFLTWNGDTLEVAGTFNLGGTQITVSTMADVYTALATVEAAGGGAVFVDNGNYTLTADILVPSGVSLVGVSRDGVIFDCDGTFAVKIAGTDVYNTGTVAISNGDTEVVGTGTTFTSSMVGQYIFLDGLWYEITAFTDTTHIDITEYQGANLSGATYVLANPNFSASIKTLSITGATGAGLVVQYAMEPTLFDLYISGNGTGIDMDYTVFPRIVVTSNENGVNLNSNYVEGIYIDYSEFSYSTSGAGMILNETNNGTIFNFSNNDNTGNGTSATNCNSLAIMSFDISGNGACGVEFISNCTDNQMTDGKTEMNGSDNVKLTATSDRNSFCQFSCKTAGGYGINIAASSCDDNQINSPAFGTNGESNTSGNINDQGTNTTISPREAIIVRTYTSNDTWSKPNGLVKIDVEMWGGGGSGGSRGGTGPASGGGGGSWGKRSFLESELGTSESVVVGSGGAAVTNDLIDSARSGNPGGNSSFGSLLTVYGGAGGVANNGGGGGGGLTSAGTAGTSDGGVGGEPSGGSGGNGAAGGTSIYGGGGGGDTAFSGGTSIYGGGGGGGDNGEGGASVYGGGGGGGSASSARLGGASIYGGNGGNGGDTSPLPTDGSIPGGGGGGARNDNITSGAGARGVVIVTEYY